MPGVPVPNAPLYLTDEVKAALLGQVSEVANEVCDGMFVACAATFLENCHRFRSPSDVVSIMSITLNQNPGQDPTDAVSSHRLPRGD